MPSNMSNLDQKRLAWVEALESGKYKQASNRLRSNEGGFCCLGVLCDIIDETAWNQQEDTFGVEDKKSWFWGDEVSFLPDEIADDYKLNTTGHGHGEYGESLVSYLMHMNDSAGQTFSEIAEYLREVWELPK